MSPPNLFPDLFSFYKFTTPMDAFGNVKLDNRVGPLEGATSDKQKISIDAALTSKIMEHFVTKSISGNISVTTVKMSPQVADNKGLLKLSEQGVYNALYQRGGNPTTEYLTERYWSCIPPKPSTPTTNKKPPAPAANDIYTRPGNFLGEVCHGGEPGFGPNIDLTVALLRAPMLSIARSNTDIIQLYLTAMPPVVANRLTPYCDVEFQIPYLPSSENQGAFDEGVINRPSLYRFLMGSGKYVNNLTDADKSLSRLTQPNKQAGINAARNPETKDNILYNATTSFFGAEMFTTPQTMINMNSLKASSAPGSSRLTDVKPFLPPASITSISISVVNAGAGTYGKRGASMSMKIHDKARLVEFAEFFRGNSGYSQATVWITYGMIAPRGGEVDEYAKMINENMLVREAYMVSQTQFTFNVDGSIDVVLTLAQKMTGQLSIATISLGSNVASLKKTLQDACGFIRQNADKYGKERTEQQGFSAAEIRIAQYIASVAEGNLDPGTDKPKLAGEFRDIEKLLKDLRASLAEKDPKKSTTLAEIQQRRPGFNIDEVEKILEKLKLIYGINSDPRQKNPVPLKEQFKQKGIDYALKKFQEALEPASPDPFFPDERNNVLAGALAPPALRYAEPPVRIFSDQFIKTCARTKPDASKQFVSFGKLFCTFCIEPLLASVAAEFGWTQGNNTRNGACPYELQIIFYQLNKNCGPASGHNIAELPLDMDIFCDGYGTMVEARGGDDITISEFIDNLNDQLSDPRHPGYGRREYYKPIPPENLSKKEKDERFKPVPADDFEANLTKWTRDYGSSFTLPQLAVSFEVEKENTTRGSATGNKNLLFELAGRVGAGNQDSPPLKIGEKIIIKVHIFDKTFSPYENIEKTLRRMPKGDLVLFDTEETANAFTLKDKEADSGDTLPEGYAYNKTNSTLTLGGEQVAVTIGQGKKALRDYLGSLMPKIDIGTNGSLISAISLASKTSGLEGTIAMMGGTQKRELSIATTGLTQAQFQQPMVVYPVSLSMTTMGCPLADMQQNFFFDFNTDTTIDNNYIVQKVTHNISPAKFETQWELSYADGYSRMVNASNIVSLLKDVKSIVGSK